MSQAQYNLSTKTDYLHRKMFLDPSGPVTIQRFEEVKYQKLQKIEQSARGFFWVPEEVNLSKDANDARQLGANKELPEHYLLDVDKPIAGQAFGCFSFISPGKILKQREMYYFEEFLKQWDMNKSMEKFHQFLNFVSFKYFFLLYIFF